MSNFSVPAWSAKPARRTVLEVMRGGVIEQEVDISEKPTYSVGRNRDFCDVPVDDQFISRKHAVLQHRDDGSSYVFDLGTRRSPGSTHGTFLNKKRLPAGEFVRIRHGDFLRFGPTEDRLFILKVEAAAEDEELAAEVQGDQPPGPGLAANEEKAALEQYLDKQKHKSFRELYEELLARELTPKQRRELQNKPVYSRLEVNWGMVDEEIIYADKTDQEILRTDLLRLLPNLTARHLSKIEDFEKKQRRLKLQIVGLAHQNDYNKIADLEAGGAALDDGQVSIKKNINEKINKLAAELSVAEDKLKQMFGLDDKKFSTPGSPEFDKAMRKGSEEDDEFFDRTLEPEKPQASAPGDARLLEAAQTRSYEQLREQLQELYDEKQSVNEALLRNAAAERDASSAADKDDLDRLVDENTRELAREERRRLITRMQQLVSEVDQ